MSGSREEEADQGAIPSTSTGPTNKDATPEGLPAQEGEDEDGNRDGKKAANRDGKGQQAAVNTVQESGGQ